MHIGFVGLGRMGGNMVRRLLRGGHTCVVYDRTPATVAQYAAHGATGAQSLAALVRSLPQPRAVWIMVPAAAVDATVAELAPLLAAGDCLIDGGNSHFEDDIRRATQLARDGIAYLDVGTSGGVWGLERGYCLMVGGDAAAVARIEPALRTLAPGAGTIARTPGRGPGEPSGPELGYLHCGGSGAGHFVKMVHNGIEYGMMAAYAEGLNLLRHAGAGRVRRGADAETAPLAHPEHYQYDFDLAAVTEVWRRGSVVTSWLLDLVAASLQADPTLEGSSPHVADSGEGRWTLRAAADVGTPIPVLSAALYQRFTSRGEDEYAARVLSAMRLAFGGHAATHGPAKSPQSAA